MRTAETKQEIHFLLGLIYILLKAAKEIPKQIEEFL